MIGDRLAGLAGPIRVLWVLKELAVGGAERLLLEIAPSLRGTVDFLPVAVFDEPRSYEVAYREAGFEVKTLGARSPLDPRWMKRLRGMIDETGVDVVHLHLPYVGALGRLASMGTGVPIVYTEHSVWPVYRPASRIANALTYRLNSAVIAVSDRVRASTGTGVLGRFVGQAPEVVHNGVSIDNVVSDARAGAQQPNRLQLAGPSYGTVGHLRREKGIDVLLRASLVVRERTPARGYVVGAGEDGPRLSALRNDLNAPVDFLGLRSDARAFIDAFDVFVLPSRAEGLPMSLLEAMALGKPIVAARTGGIPEAIEEGDNGLLFEVGDEDALADSIVRLLEDPDLGRRLGARARNVARDRFSAEAMARGYQETYASLLVGGAR